MENSDYIIRNYRTSDYDSLVRLNKELAKSDAGGGHHLAGGVRYSLGRPGHMAEEDLFVAETPEGIVGYLDIMAEPGIGRVVIECLVLGKHRRKGIARDLFKRAVLRARTLGAGVAHVNVGQGNHVARQVLESSGFKLVRRHHELRVHLEDVPDYEAKATCPIRLLHTGEEGMLADIQNRAFTGSWGFSPNTVEDIAYALAPGDSADAVLLALGDDGVTGYVWTSRELHDGPSEWRGRIGMIGVDPRYRGSGIGRDLLLSALALFRSRGLRFAQLTVDSENSAAIALYRSLGFKTVNTSLWYEKSLN